MSHVIETVGRWGTKTSPRDHARMTRPRAGDVIDFGEELRRYPVSHRHCRISDIDRDTRMVSIVDGMGSAFLDEDAGLSISGGPFFSVPVESLEPTFETHRVRVWNWGNNLPGANQGVDYHIDRPVFRATRHPYDHAIRYATSETGARRNDYYRHGAIADDATLIRSWDAHDGLTAYLFDVRTTE